MISKKIFVSSLVITGLALSGCGAAKTPVTTQKDANTPAVEVASTQPTSYTNDLFSVTFPTSYKVASEVNEVTIIANEKGRIEIGKFDPSVSPGPQPGMTQAQVDEFPKDHAFHGYAGDVASALFYTTGDTATMKELKAIQDSIKLAENKYVSTLYGFKFAYPKEGYNIHTIGMENFTNGQEKYGVEVSKGNTETFNVSVLITPTMSTQGDVDTKVLQDALKTQNIKKIAEMAFAVNKGDTSGATPKIIEGVKEISINGTKAYQFTLADSEAVGFFKTFGGRVLDSTTRIIFVSDGENLYKLSAPKNPVSDEILTSLTFLKK